MAARDVLNGLTRNRFCSSGFPAPTLRSLSFAAILVADARPGELIYAPTEQLAAVAPASTSGAPGFEHIPPL
jgi:hypothetical protein